jgi:nucleotide-binding universal stress UspA family protein
MSLRRILCPVDFSEASASAARYAAALACRHMSELTLVHVAPAMNFEFAMAPPRPELLSEFAEHRNQTVRHALDMFPGEDPLSCVAQRELRQGDAATEIVSMARQGGYDLIVMSTHGSGAIRRWLLVGSVTTKVLHTAECPVLAATEFEAGGREFGSILCAVDLGPASRRVLCSAAGLARRTGAALTVVHVAGAFGEAARDFVDPEWRSTVTLRLRETLATLQRETSADGDVVVEDGEPHVVVPHVAERIAADLIVIGRGVHTGMLGRLRARAYDIIRNAPCPVLSV